MSATASAEQVARFLYEEARWLDEREWDLWLALYAPDAVFHLPAWRDEAHLTTDPDTEVSQIYHDSRRGLEERVARVRSGKSVTALPLPRATHFVSNVLSEPRPDGALTVRANWMVQVYQPRTARQHVNFGRYEYVLSDRDGAFVIRRKMIVLNNDCVPTLVDFYTL